MGFSFSKIGKFSIFSEKGRFLTKETRSLFRKNDLFPVFLDFLKSQDVSALGGKNLGQVDCIAIN